MKREIDEVVEIERKVPPLAEDHLPEDRDSRGGRRFRTCHESRDVGSSALEGGELVHVVPDDPGLARDAALLKDLLDEGLHVLLVEDDEVLRVAQAVYLLAEELHAEPVYGRHEVADNPAGTEGGDAALHLLRGLVREGHAEDVALGDAHVVHEIGEAVDERAGLSGARPGYDAHSPLCRLDGVLLLGGQGNQVCADSRHTVRGEPPTAAE